VKDFFISYNKADEKIASWIAGVLQAQGYSFTLQARDFPKSGGNFIVLMDDAIRECERLVVVHSSNYTSDWVKAEWTAYFSRDPLGKNRSIIVFKIDDTPVNGLLSSYVYVDLSKDTPNELRERIRIAVSPNSWCVPTDEEAWGFRGNSKQQILPADNNIPYPQNKFFVEQTGKIADIQRKFTDEKFAVHTLCGLGGVGKTQLALEFSYRYSLEYNTIWWIYAHSPSMIFQGFRGFAIMHDIIPEDESCSTEQLKQHIQDWFNNHEKYLFVLDNAENFDDIQGYLPYSNLSNGNILITTRKHSGFPNSVATLLFNPLEAVDFICKRTSIYDFDALATQIASRLGRLPLALEQACAYINRVQCSFERYINKLDEQGLGLLDNAKSTPNPDDEYYQKVVGTTWNISIEKLGDVAKELMCLCSYMSPVNIPVDLFPIAREYLPESLAEKISESNWDEIASDLTELSLLQKNHLKDGNYDEHPLLQEVIRNQIEHRGDIGKYINSLVGIFKFLLPKDYPTNPPRNMFLRLKDHAVLSIGHLSKINKPSANGYASELCFLVQKGAVAIFETDLALSSCLKFLDFYKRTDSFKLLPEVNEKNMYIILCDVYMQLHAIYGYLGDDVKSAHYKNKWLEILSDESTPIYQQIDEELKDINKSFSQALMFFSSGDLDNARVVAEQIESQFQSLSETALESNERIQVQSWITFFPYLLELRDVDENALNEMQSACEELERTLGKSYETGVLYFYLSMFYVDNDDYKHATVCAEKCVQIYKNVIGDNPMTISAYQQVVMCLKMSHVFSYDFNMKLRCKDKALYYIDEALNMIHRLEKNENTVLAIKEFQQYKDYFEQ